jgi:hypothetical protein
MLNKTEFNTYFVAHRKDDPAREPVAVEFSPVAVLAEAENRTGRPRAGFKIRQISKEEYETLKKLLS